MGRDSGTQQNTEEVSISSSLANSSLQLNNSVGIWIFMRNMDKNFDILKVRKFWLVSINLVGLQTISTEQEIMKSKKNQIYCPLLTINGNY